MAGYLGHSRNKSASVRIGPALDLIARSSHPGVGSCFAAATRSRARAAASSRQLKAQLDLLPRPFALNRHERPGLALPLIEVLSQILLVDELRPGRKWPLKYFTPDSTSLGLNAVGPAEMRLEPQ